MIIPNKGWNTLYPVLLPRAKKVNGKTYELPIIKNYGGVSHRWSVKPFGEKQWVVSGIVQFYAPPPNNLEV